MTTPAAFPAATDTLRGSLLVLIAAMAWSFGGVFARLLTTDAMTAVAWRSFFGGLFLLVPFVMRHRRASLQRLFRLGGIGLATVLAQIICQICTVTGLYFTTVANVTAIYATAPFVAAALAWWWIGERITRRTLFAMVVALGGVAIVVSGSVGSGHLFGDMLALVMMLTFAFMIVTPRVDPSLDIMGVTIVSAFTTFLVALPFSTTASLDGWNWAVLMGFGFNNLVLAQLFFLAGARLISAAQSGLIATLEIVLAPLWVWALFDERPGLAAIVGGGIILLTIVQHILATSRVTRLAAS